MIRSTMKIKKIIFKNFQKILNQTPKPRNSKLETSGKRPLESDPFEHRKTFEVQKRSILAINARSSTSSHNDKTNSMRLLIKPNSANWLIESGLQTFEVLCNLV